MPNKHDSFWPPHIVVISGITLMMGLAMPAHSEESKGYSLTTLPTNCVSLKRGLVCYQQVHMTWQAPEVGDYCVVRTDTGIAQKCWLQQQSASFSFEFAEPSSKHYSLRHRNHNIDLATVQIEVKWVYKRRRHDRLNWSIF